MKRFTVPMLAALLLVGWSQSSQAELRYLETSHLRLIYTHPIHTFLAKHVARCFENAMAFHQSYWDGPLNEKVMVLLYDLSDYGNGGARNIPTDIILVAIAPFNYLFETMPANERMNTLMNHELVHIYAMDKASSGDRFFRHLFFGKPVPTADNPLSIFYSYLATPRRSAPRWYQEGIAVFLETWMAGGYGRALGAYDEMVFRTRVADNARFYDPVSLEAEGTRIDFHVGVNSYLYGTRFFSHLASAYGPERVATWVRRSDGTKAYFLSQFKQAFGRSLDNEWAAWVTSEREFQDSNLAAIRRYPVTPYRDLTAHALGSISRSFFDSSDGRLFVAVNYPGTLPHIAAVNLGDGSVSKICDVRGAALFFVTSLAYDPAAHSLFYTTDNYAWRDLHVVDTKTRKSRLLMKDARIGDLAFNRADQSLWGVRHSNGISTLVRIPAPYKEWNTVYVWPYGKIIHDIDVSPDGSLLSAALADVRGRQILISMSIPDLLKGDSTYKILYDFGTSNPETFTFAPGGRRLYGTSYYTGASNVFRYDISRDSMEALSNCETGFFRPIPCGSDSLIVFRFTAQGFVPSKIPEKPIEDINPIKFFGQTIVEKFPVVKSWMVGSPGAVNIESLTVREGQYRSLANLRIRSVQPVVEGYKDFAAFGLRFDFADLLSFHSGVTTVSYTPNRTVPVRERWHLNWQHSYQAWSASAKYNATDFYDLFGPTKRSRKGYSFGLGYQREFISDEPVKMEVGAEVERYGDLQTLPDYQNVESSVDKFTSMAAHWRYENLTASLGAVEYEKGVRGQIIATTELVAGRAYPHVLGTFDWGTPLPIKHSSIWLRTSAGYSHGGRDEPLANFYFGGFGNNWVDHLTEKRYREYYAFPGVELNAVGGTDYGKALLEWNLPPILFKRLGFPALYASWMRASLFSTGIITNINARDYERRLVNAGIQVDLRLQLLSDLKLTFSAGYAMAFEKHMTPARETMVSLRIL